MKTLAKPPRKVPAGWVVRYGYASFEDFAGFTSYGGVQWERVQEYAGLYADIGDDAQFVDAPWVEWLGAPLTSRWKVADGRHRTLALLGVGYGTILVRWMERT